MGTSPLHALAVAVVLFVLTVPLALRMARREGQPWLVPLLLGGFGLHLVGSLAQILIVRIVYHNSADFHLYTGTGAELAHAWLSGQWLMPGRDIPGTGGVSLVTGVVFTLTGVDQAGGFFVFTWLSFLGLVAFYRAFRLALPGADAKRYALIIFLLPSLWYWPSVAGKEAVMMLALGLMALGAAHLLRTHWGGVLPMLVGAALGALIRPHEVALAFGGFAVAVLVHRSRRPDLATPVRRVAGLLVVVAVGIVLARVTMSYLGISGFSAASISEAINSANEATQGVGEGFGSSIQVWNPSPLYYPVDVYLVLFKPTLLEVTSVSQFIAAGENLLLMALFVWCWRSFLRIPGKLRDEPYVALCLSYSLVFFYLFSALGNVGLLVRERTLLFPFMFVLFALRDAPVPAPRRYDWRALTRSTSSTETR